jgi:hypothetical protein
MKCKWVDDRCQHGYWIDEEQVTVTKIEGKVKHLCPKGARSLPTPDALPADRK